MDYKVEELKPPLPTWRETTIKFDAVKLEKKKGQYKVDELKRLTDEKMSLIDTQVTI